MNYIDYVASNDRVIMNDGLMMIWKEAIVTCFDALTYQWLGLRKKTECLRIVQLGVYI
jgi:hypothetical protein